MIPNYPDRTPLLLEHRAQFESAFSGLRDDVSEFTFANLYLFRRHYAYEVTRVPGAGGAGADGAASASELAITGVHDGGRFWIFPIRLPGEDVLRDIQGAGDDIKCIPERERERAARLVTGGLGYRLIADRGNFDYLYLRSDMAELAGRKFHKKRNLLNYFRQHHEYEHAPLVDGAVDGAQAVLDTWIADQPDDDAEHDYVAAKEALQCMRELSLIGYLTKVDGVPAGYAMGEVMADGRTFVVHFEKGVTEYKGIYQFVNNAMARELPAECQYINREQDLSDMGLRQAKMTYRPVGFVRKYRLVLPGRAGLFEDDDARESEAGGEAGGGAAGGAASGGEQQQAPPTPPGGSGQ